MPLPDFGDVAEKPNLPDFGEMVAAKAETDLPVLDPETQVPQFIRGPGGIKPVGLNLQQATDPILQLPRLQSQRPPAGATPVLDPETQLPVRLELPGGRSQPTGVDPLFAATVNTPIGLAEGAGSPLGFATIPFAGTRAGAALIRGIFGALAAKQGAQQLGEASVTGDVQKGAEGALQLAAAPAITGFGGRAKPLTERTTYAISKRGTTPVPVEEPPGDREKVVEGVRPGEEPAVPQEPAVQAPVPAKGEDVTQSGGIALFPTDELSIKGETKTQFDKITRVRKRLNDQGKTVYVVEHGDGQVGYTDDPAIEAHPKFEEGNPPTEEGAGPEPPPTEPTAPPPTPPPTAPAAGGGTAAPTKALSPANAGKAFRKLVEADRGLVDQLGVNHPEGMYLSEDGQKMLSDIDARGEGRGTGPRRSATTDFINWLMSDKVSEGIAPDALAEHMEQVKRAREIIEGKTEPTTPAAPAAEAPAREFEKSSGFTFNPEGVKTEGLTPEQKAQVGQQWEFTDKRAAKDSPTAGMSFYVPEGSTLEQIKAAHEAKLKVEKPAEIATKPAETATIPAESATNPAEAKIAELNRQLAKEQKALDKNIAKMGTMVPPPIVAEITRKIATRMAKIQDQIDALEKLGAETKPAAPATEEPVAETKAAEGETPTVEPVTVAPATPPKPKTTPPADPKRWIKEGWLEQNADGSWTVFSEPGFKTFDTIYQAKRFLASKVPVSERPAIETEPSVAEPVAASPTVAPAAAKVEAEGPTPRPADLLNKSQLIEQLIGKKPEMRTELVGQRVQWEKDRKAYAKLTVAELRDRLTSNQKDDAAFKARQETAKTISPEVQKIADDAGASWRTALKSKAAAEGVTFAPPTTSSKGEAVYTLSTALAEKKIREGKAAKEKAALEAPAAPTTAEKVSGAPPGPGLVGMGGAAAGEIQETGPRGEPTHGIAARVSEQRRLQGVIAPVEPGEGISAPESVEHGRALLEQGADPQRVLDEFNRTKAVTADGMAVVRAHGERLAKAAYAAADRYGIHSPEYEAAWEADSGWTQKIKPMQTEWHKIGQAQQGEVEIDTGTFHGLRRAFKDATGKDFTPTQADEAVRIAKGVKEATEAADKAKEEVFAQVGKEAAKPVEKAPPASKPGQPAKPQPITLWKRAKAILDAGETDFDAIRHKLAIEFGIPVQEVTRILAEPKVARTLTDDMYRKMSEQRRLVSQAKNWLKNQEIPRWQRFIRAVPRVFFTAKIFGHGTVGMITHAGLNIFNPGAWRTYWPNFLRQYKLMVSPAYHERMMQDLIHDPLYTTARRAGLVNDAFRYQDDYQTPQMAKWLGRIGLLGNRGFDALKLFRQARFSQIWNGLPDTLKTKDQATLLADSVNHATGAINMRFREWANWTFFAPKLEGSRWAWMVKDPLNAAKTFLDWGNATPEQRSSAMSELKQKAAIAGTYYGLLALNQGLLSASGSDDKINFSNPKRGDFMAFKAAGHNVGIVSPMLGMVRLFANLVHATMGKRGKLESLTPRAGEVGQKLEEYTRGKLSPFASFGADVVSQADFQGRPMPYSTDKTPAYLRRQGIGKYTYGQYAAQEFTPIPVSEAIREVWRDQGMNENDIDSYLKALLVGVVTGGTGARVSAETPAQSSSKNLSKGLTPQTRRE